MKKSGWKKKIRAACEEAGTYRPFFDSVIDTLAGIMELRDEAERQFEESGGKTVVEHVMKTGAVNRVKNPALVVVMDCNTQALQHWRDLGLTPAGYKRLDAEIVKEDSKGAFEKLLAGLT